MRVLAIVHQEDAGAGVFGAAIAARAGHLDNWLVSDGKAPPGDPFAYDAVLVLGGSMNVDQEQSHAWLAAEKALLRDLLAAGRPLLGLCLGGQLLAEAAGAKPRRLAHPEIGWHRVELTPGGEQDPLLGPLAPGFEAFQWHSYEFPLPPGAVLLARSEACPQGARLGPAAWALQFHPEVSAADAQHWIEDFRSDPDAVAIGVEPVALGAETEQKIGAFNQLGRGICRRWLALAEA